MRRIAPLFVCTLLLLSCSDNGTMEQDPHAGIPIGAVTKTITPDGGSIQTRADEGGPVFTLDFPAGAVRSPIAITVDPQAPDAGLWFDVALEPAGMVFFEPVGVTVEMPEGTGLSDGQMMFLRPDDPVYVPTTANASDHTLSTSLTFFGYTEDGSRSVAGSAAFEPSAGGGNNLGGGPVDCAAVIASAKAWFDLYISTGQFEDAVDAALGISAMLERATCFAEAADWLDTAKNLICQKLNEAIDHAATTPTTNYGDFKEQAQGIITWASMALRFNPDCDAAGDFYATLGSEAADYVAFFIPRMNALNADDWETFSDLKDEAITAMEVEVDARMLGIADAADKVHDEAFLPAVDRMREVAFAMCRDHGWHYPLSRLTATGFFARRDIIGVTPPRPGSLAVTGGFADFSDQDIFDDMQMCGTSVDVKTKVSSGGDFTDAHFEGTAPGQNTRELTIDCPTRGTLVLDGRIDAFTCWNDLHADNEVTTNLNFDDILTLRRPVAGDEYFAGTPVEIDIDEAARQAGFTPKEGFSTDLVLTRNRADCDDRMWGAGDTEILRATLRWKNPTLDVEVDFPDTVDAGDAVPVTVRVKVIDLLGQAGFFDAIDLVLNVSGGSAAQTTGQTDGNGEFTTTITAANPNLAPGDAGTAAAQSFGINVTATSFEGVSAQQSASATVISCPATGHELRNGGNGHHTIDNDYGEQSVWASAGANEYSYATAEFIDYFSVTPDDASLIGQRGYVYIKVHYHIQTSGYSSSNPAARVVIGPRNGYSSPYFWQRNFNTPASGEARDYEDDWEIPISCTFGRSSAPLDVNLDVFAKSTDAGPSTISGDLTWVGITKVTREDGTPLGSYKICTGSGTNYR